MALFSLQKNRYTHQGSFLSEGKIYFIQSTQYTKRKIHYYANLRFCNTSGRWYFEKRKVSETVWCTQKSNSIALYSCSQYIQIQKGDGQKNFSNSSAAFAERTIIKKGRKGEKREGRWRKRVWSIPPIFRENVYEYDHSIHLCTSAILILTLYFCRCTRSAP